MQVPVLTARLSCKKLKSKQSYYDQNWIGDSMLNNIPLACSTIEDLFTGSIKFITFAAIDSGYSGSFTDIFVPSIHS